MDSELPHLQNSVFSPYRVKPLSESIYRHRVVPEKLRSLICAEICFFHLLGLVGGVAGISGQSLKLALILKIYYSDKENIHCRIDREADYIQFSFRFWSALHILATIHYFFQRR